jgi:DNA-binding CsgD family transcriptional regulator
MNDAFQPIYGGRSSALSRVLGPLIAPGTYLRTLHMFAMFPAGIAYFVVLVTGFAVGFSLVWTIVGPVVLLALLYLTRWAGDIESYAIRHVAGIELKRPPTKLERGLSFRTQVWTRLIDPTTWTGLLYLLVQFPLGIGLFVAMVVGGAVSGALIVSPFLPDPEPFEFDLLWWDVTETTSRALYPVAGVLLFVAMVHIVNAFSALHALWAQLLLGSRAKNVPVLPELPPDEPDGGPPESDRVTPPVLPATPSQPSILEGGAGGSPPSLAPGSALLDEGLQARLQSLTPREREVLHLVAQGHYNAEIAEAFVISEGTVKTHVKRLFSKLETRDRTQAAVFAYEAGLVRPSAAAVEPASESEQPIPLRARR